MLDDVVFAHQQLKRDPDNRRLPRVYTLVFAHPIGGWTSPLDLEELLGPGIPGVVSGAPRFCILLDDISKASNREIQALSVRPETKLGIWLLRDSRDTKALFHNLRRWRRVFDEMFAASSVQVEEAYGSMLSYLDAVLSEADLREFVRRIGEQPRAKETTMHYGERIRAEGVQEGLQGALERLLRRKFGVVDDVHLARLRAADEAELDRFLDRILTATSVDDVFAATAA